eukprot:1744974-Rhodomonas_salina.5
MLADSERLSRQAVVASERDFRAIQTSLKKGRAGEVAARKRLVLLTEMAAQRKELGTGRLALWTCQLCHAKTVD